MEHLIVAVCVANLLVLTGCDGTSVDDTSLDVGENGLAITVADIPEEVLCIRVKVTADEYSKVKTKEVTDTEVEFIFSNLPVGAVEVEMAAYNLACSEVDQDTQAAYFGSRSAVIQEGEMTELIIALTMVGGLSIGANWNSSCVPGDGDCPDGCNANNDSDCEPVCGNNIVEDGEQCDPCPESCEDDNPCTEGNVASGSAFTCDLICEQTLVSCACMLENGCIAENVGTFSNIGEVLELIDYPGNILDGVVASYYGGRVANDITVSSECGVEVVNDIRLSDATDIDEIQIVAHGDAASSRGGAGVSFDVLLYDTSETEYVIVNYSEGGTSGNLDFNESLSNGSDVWVNIKRILIRMNPGGSGVPPEYGGRNQCTAEARIHEVRIFGTGAWGADID